ncbi:MAG: thiamine phosphate synthase [Gemmatimonadales bacterium]|nr:thiamine phosphate synthase [Gemmatimonadales bacterium]
MRPLPRLHAITDAEVLGAPDLAVRAAAIAAAGPAVALHVRDRAAGGAALARITLRLIALARPPEAAVFVNGRPDVAAAAGAQGVQLASDDISPREARTSFVRGWIGCSVHTAAEAAAAVGEGADFLLVGNVYQTASHPGRPAAGLDLVREAASWGAPVIAIGGINAARAAEVRLAGAYGTAAIGALWRTADPAAAAMALLAPWLEDA